MPRVAALILAGVIAASAAAQFEVATVKRSPPPAGDLINIDLGTIRNGKVTLGNASLSDCLKLAFGLVSDEQLSGPDWITSKAIRFDLVGQAPAGATLDQMLLMLQNLLTERLKLVLHREQKEFRYLALVVGKNGPKFHPATVDPANPQRNPAGLGRIAGKEMPMSVLARLLSRFEHQIVVDETGLKGPFVVTLEWSQDTDSASGPSIFTAVQEQLGLRLESRKGPLEVLVVDHAEQIPTEN